MLVDLDNTPDMFGTCDTSTDEVNAFIGTVITFIIIIILSNKSEDLESNFNIFAANLDCHTLLFRSNRMALLSAKDYKNGSTS